MITAFRMKCFREGNFYFMKWVSCCLDGNFRSRGEFRSRGMRFADSRIVRSILGVERQGDTPGSFRSDFAPVRDGIPPKQYFPRKHFHDDDPVRLFSWQGTVANQRPGPGGKTAGIDLGEIPLPDAAFVAKRVVGMSGKMDDLRELIENLSAETAAQDPAVFRRVAGRHMIQNENRGKFTFLPVTTGSGSKPRRVLTAICRNSKTL